MVQWYFVENQQKQGPVTEEQFHQQVKDGRILPETLVWREGMSDWRPYRELAPAPAPSPAPSPAAEAALAEKKEESTCIMCGKNFSPDNLIRYRDSLVCAGCKPAFVQRLKEGAQLPGAARYAGFWIRFVAKFIDGIILLILSSVIALVHGFVLQAAVDMERPNMGVFFAIQGVITLFQIAIGATYTSWFLGKYAATPGKMALGLKVLRPTGEQLTYLRALGRHFAEWISGMILAIGYIMAGFDDEKRALHDRICDTRVVRK